MDKVALEQVFSEYFGFPCQLSFHRLLHTHHHLPPGDGTRGQIVADVPSGLDLTPPQRNLKTSEPAQCRRSTQPGRSRRQQSHGIMFHKMVGFIATVSDHVPYYRESHLRHFLGLVIATRTAAVSATGQSVHPPACGLVVVA
jgi:hypothetical protein